MMNISMSKGVRLLGVARQAPGPSMGQQIADAVLGAVVDTPHAAPDAHWQGARPYQPPPPEHKPTKQLDWPKHEESKPYVNPSKFPEPLNLPLLSSPSASTLVYTHTPLPQPKPIYHEMNRLLQVKPFQMPEMSRPSHRSRL
jgi:hypothetical protein